MSTSPATANLQAPSLNLATSSIQELESFCRDQPLTAAGYIRDLLRAKTDTFPGTTFVKRGNDGLLQKVVIGVTLSHVAGDLTELEKGKFDISAQGYRRLNGHAGITVITPETVTVDDRRQPNPYIEISATSGHAKTVVCRRIAVGAVPGTGNLVATDVLLRLDLNVYLLEAMLGKIKKWESATDKEKGLGPVGEMGLLEAPPPATAQTAWKFLAIGDMGMGCWVNMRSRPIGDALREHMTKVKFAERLAQTIAERNALKAHPSMPSSIRDVKNGVAIVKIVAWQRPDTQIDLDKIRQLVQENRLHEVAETHKLELSELDIVADQTVNEVTADQEAAEGKVKKEEAEPEVETPTDNPAPLLTQANEWYGKIVSRKGVRAVKEIFKEIGFTALEEANDDQLTAFVRKAANSK